MHLPILIGKGKIDKKTAIIHIFVAAILFIGFAVTSGLFYVFTHPWF